MEGIRGLFKGVNPTLAGVIPYMGLNFAVYETLKAEAITRVGPTAVLCAVSLPITRR